jgi:hypothetical protein
VLTPVRIFLCALAAVAALGLCACGGGGGGVSSDDPASLAPADAPIYVQAVLRPKGKQKTDVEALASKVSGFDDPFGQLASYIDSHINDEPTLSGRRLSFEKDIEPWAGSEAGLFVPSLAGDDPPAAGIVQTTDPKATQQFIDDARQKGDHEGNYKGVKYLIDGDDGTSIGVVGDFLVVGDESAFKQAVDVSKGADSLGDQGDFSDALGQAPTGSMVDVYASLESIWDEIRSDDPGSAKTLSGIFGDPSGKSVLASVVPSSETLELDLATDAERKAPLADLSSLIETFPADSFAAFGVPDLGARVRETIDQLESSGTVSKDQVDGQLSALGLSVGKITSALGDLGIFAEGSDLTSLQGAAVISSDDPARAAKLIEQFRNLALVSGQGGVGPSKVGKGLTLRNPQELGPQPLTITTQGDKIVIGYGEQATEQAASGGGKTLVDDPTYQKAVDALGGDGVSGYFSLSKIFQLADGLGAIEDAGYQQARPYLDKLSYAVLGSGAGGDWQNSKVIVGVKP